MSTDNLLGDDGMLPDWQAGLFGGLLGGFLFGVLLTFVSPETLESTIAGLVGAEGMAVGWAVHVSIAVLFGLVFAGIGQSVPQLVDDSGEALQLGAVYGFALWLVFAVFGMPIVLEAVGYAEPPEMPHVDLVVLAGHLLYGVVLGGMYAALTD